MLSWERVAQHNCESWKELADTYQSERESWKQLTDIYHRERNERHSKVLQLEQEKAEWMKEQDALRLTHADSSFDDVEHHA
jgi:hypothetical protein